MKILLVSKWVDGATSGNFHHSGEWAETFELACSLSNLGNHVALVTPRINQRHKKNFEKEFGRLLKEKNILHFITPVHLNFGLNEGVFQWYTHWSILKAIGEFKPQIIQFMQLTPTYIHLFTKTPIFFYGIVIDFRYPKQIEDTRQKIEKLLNKRNLLNIFANFLYFRSVKLLGLDDYGNLTRIGIVILKHKKGYRFLKKNALQKEKVFFVQKGVNIEKARSSRLSNQTVLFIGSITYRKGIFDLVKAFQKVSLKFPKAKLIIAGTGPRALVSKLKIEIADSQAYEFLDSVSYKKKWKLYQKADIFCLPSYSDASPAVILEAMANRLPVITTYEADPPIKNYEDGVLVKAGDIEALANVLNKLLSDHQLSMKLGVAAQKLIRSYSWTIQSKKLLQLYEKELKFPK